jgi:hypothetical protein
LVGSSNLPPATNLKARESGLFSFLRTDFSKLLKSEKSSKNLKISGRDDTRGDT